MAAPRRFGPFVVVDVDNGASLDFMTTGPEWDIGIEHYAFLVGEDEFDQIFGRVQARGLAYYADPHGNEPGEINHHDGGRGVYWHDPDGHVLEIIHFPPGKGDARWHATSDRLFLGIDHTAIVVDDTERSLLFYRDALGMRIAGESENHGIEQERLNSVFGARLRITTLRARSGPGVELLEYLAPSDGRARSAAGGD